MARSSDDGVRGKFAVCLSMHATDAGVELTMDDVVLDHPGAGTDRLWRHKTFITFADISSTQLQGGMTPDDFERFGRFVFGSVAAIAQFRVKKNEA